MRRRLAAVVISLAGLLLAAAACRPVPQGPPEADGPAIAPPQPLNPAGDVTGAVVFEWRDGHGPADDGSRNGPVYRVSVFDAAERRLLEWETRFRRADAPLELAPFLKPGETLLWRVAALDASGQPARTSPLTRFTIRDSGFRGTAPPGDS